MFALVPKLYAYIHIVVLQYSHTEVRSYDSCMLHVMYLPVATALVHKN